MGRARLVAVLLVLVASAAWAGLPTVAQDGQEYVELARLASLLKARLEASADSPHARLISQGRIITFTRNWTRVTVNGSPILLDAPVRVRKGVWLVPESFVEQVRPRIVTASTTAAPSAAPVPALPSAARTPVALEEVRHRSYPSFTRVVIEASGPLAYRVETAGTKESRIRLLMLAGFPRTQEIGDGLIDELRLERAGDDALLRVVFEGATGELRVSTLADPPRLVLDFARPSEPTPRERRETIAPLRLVVLDAGHGGHDTGAIGPGGLQEKDLVLDVTRRVARLLEERLDVKVLLSRDADQFVTLRDRTTYANRERADLFVSIHANAHRETASAGVETYFLSSEATDGTARQVAALENSVVQLEKTPARPAGRLDAVKAILWDLAQSEFQQESSRLAEVVQDSMTQSLRIPNRGVKQAGFYVLGGAAMPAVLIEIGFVTNPKEERRLKDTKYRDEIARAIYAGLAEYKKRYELRDVSPTTRGARER